MYNKTVLVIIIQLIQLGGEFMFQLDVKSRLPIYEQLVYKIKEQIITEILKPDEKLPSVRVLAKELTVNPNTIQKAYRELERQGYIYSIKGKGNFVSVIQSKVNNEKLNALRKELKKIISEAMFLGMTKDELIELIETIENEVGGNDNDKSQ